MSRVQKDRRKESSVQFIDTARALVEHMLTYIKKFPQNSAERIAVTERLVKPTWEIHDMVVMANSVFPTTPQDVAVRRCYWQKARGYIRVVDSSLSIILCKYKNKINVSEKCWEDWGKLLKDEDTLIKKVLLSDSKIVF